MDLNVPFSEKDAAKALGARWDAGRRLWVAPPGADPSVFAQWSPQPALFAQDQQQTPVDTAPEAPDAPRGVSLSELMRKVTAKVAEGFPGAVWVRVEVASLKRQSRGIYLELSERADDGALQAKATGVMWNKQAARILRDFEAATGAPIAAEMKLLILAQPRFAPQFGFCLEIVAIDPSFTLGAMQAKLQQIRGRLRVEGLYDKQRRLAAPKDFFHVLVVAPAGAAGLGDFLRDARVLEHAGICTFTTANAMFQGQSAPEEICGAIAWGLGQCRRPDAIAIIRGGGAACDIAWVNDYSLARTICELPVPVFTGIGHQKDNTILDEVAHTRFDTPSKVIAGIRDTIGRRARSGREAIATIQTASQARVSAAREQLQHHRTEVERTANRNTAKARLRLAELSQRTAERARTRVATARTRAAIAVQTVQSSGTGRLQRARSLVAGHQAAVGSGGRNATSLARSRARSLLREILVQGPQRVLERGFTYLRGADGTTRTTAAGLQPGETIIATLKDGTAELRVVGATSADRGH